MFRLHASKSILELKEKEPLVSGAVNAVYVKFTFSANWDGLEKTVVFRAGEKTVSLLLEKDLCPIPWEVLESAGVSLSVGLYGKQDGIQVLPTIWISLGIIQEGAKPGEDSRPPTLELWEQMLFTKQDKLFGKPGQVVGFDEEGNATARDNLCGGEGDSGLPAGCIVMWSGAASDVPGGWVLCDGDNGTPDLRDRFVVGAGNLYEKDSTGGEAEHILDIKELPPRLSVSPSNYGNLGTKIGAFVNSTSASAQSVYSQNYLQIRNAENEPFSIIPPYYALCFIMKL